MSTENKYVCDYGCGFSTENEEELILKHHPIILLERTINKQNKLYIEYEKHKEHYAHIDLCPECLKKYEETLTVAIDQFNSVMMGFLPKNTKARFFDKNTGEEISGKEVKKSWWQILTEKKDE